MKKLIAISVVFVLLSAAAFAVDLGGTVFGVIDLASSQGGGDAVVLGNGANSRVRLEGSGEADIGIGSVGGWMRFDIGGNTDATGVNSWGKAWWQPIDALRIQIGQNPDGEFDTSHITRYGFYAQANEINKLVNSDGNWGPVSSDTAIFGGASSMGDFFALIITPMDALTINIALPFNTVPVETADLFKLALFQVNYSAGFGAIHVTYQGLGGDTDPTGKLFASVFLSMIDNLGLELGVGYALKDQGADQPLGIGLGVKYDMGQFGVKLRAFFGIPMGDGDGDIAIRADVLPYFAVNDNVTIFADAGIYMPDGDHFAWHFAPYVRIGSEWGPGFYAGLNFNNGNGASDAKVNWAIPIGILVSF
jgi:hypothetical protein